AIASFTELTTLVLVPVWSSKITFQVPWTCVPWKFASPVSPAVPTNGRFSVCSGLAQGGVAWLQSPTGEFGDSVSGPIDWPPMLPRVGLITTRRPFGETT